MSRGARLNTKFKIVKNKKPKRCKFEGCNKIIREENKSEYCSMHGNKILHQKMMKNKVAIHIDKEIQKVFKQYCQKSGFIVSRKMEIILVEFLKKENE